MQKPLISIIIPCYNVEDYIERCVESVLNQTIGLDSMDIILVDDCSTDGTREIIRYYEDKYLCIRSIFNDENLRQGGARNRGLKLAQGKYVGFVDSDDWIEPQMYEDMCKTAEIYGCDVVNILSVRDREYGYLKYIPLEECEKTVIEIKNDRDRADMIASGQVKIGAWNCIFLRNLIEQHAITFAERVVYEDIYWGALVHLYFTKACRIDKPYYHYFIRNDSTVLDTDVKKHEDFFVMQRYLWDELCKRGAINKYGESIEFDYIMNFYIIGLKMLSLRYKVFPYDLYYRMRKDVIKRIPLWNTNHYIKGNTTEFQKIQLEMLKYELSHSELDQFADVIRKHYGA